MYLDHVVTASIAVGDIILLLNPHRWLYFQPYSLTQMFTFKTKDLLKPPYKLMVISLKSRKNTTSQINKEMSK